MARKILLVEDDADQASLYMQILHVSGYEVVATANAEDARARLTAERFNLLLEDWDLGTDRMQGDALIVWAKAHDPNMRAILFSNHWEVAEIAAACGADAYFRKVEGIKPLRELVAQHVPLDAN